MNDMIKQYILVILIAFTVPLMAQEQDSIDVAAQWGLCESTIKYTSTTQMLRNVNPLVLVAWEDFRGPSLDQMLWNYNMQERSLVTNHEQQYYTYGNNIQFQNGVMALVAKREVIMAKAIEYLSEDTLLPYYNSDGNQVLRPNYRRFDYTSGEIQSNKKFQYGLYLARIKVPNGKGFWPAFWLYGGSPVYNEADIFEFFNSHNLFSNYYYPKKLKTNLHYEYWGEERTCSKTSFKQDFSKNYHIFGMYWGRDVILWYLDGRTIRVDFHWFHRSNNGMLSPVAKIEPGVTYVENQAYPHDPMRIFFNLAVRSDTEAPNSNTPLPSKMEIDWFMYFNHAAKQDVYVTNYNQQPLDTDFYNSIIGNTVTFDCNYPVYNDQFLSAKGKNEVIIKPGFHAQKGSIVKIQIDNNLWDRTEEIEKYADVEAYASAFEQHKELYENTQESSKMINIDGDDILIYLKQKDKHVVVNFGSLPYENYNVSIINMNGHTIVPLDQITSSITSFDISSCAQGFYIVRLVNNKTGVVTIKKVVLF